MKRNYGKIIKIPAGLLLDRIQGLNSLFCLVQVCPIVSVRGKTPIPMVPWGYSHHTRRQEAVQTLQDGACAGGKVPLLDRGMHDMRSRRECKQPGLSLTSSTPRRHSQLSNLSICGRRWEAKGIQPPFLSRLSAFCRGQLSPWIGTGHKAPLWAVQSSDHSQTCGLRLMVSPVFRLDHYSLCVWEKGVKKQKTKKHVHVCLSCESINASIRQAVQSEYSH